MLSMFAFALGRPSHVLPYQDLSTLQVAPRPHKVPEKQHVFSTTLLASVAAPVAAAVALGARRRSAQHFVSHRRLHSKRHVRAPSTIRHLGLQQRPTVVTVAGGYVNAAESGVSEVARSSTAEVSTSSQPPRVRFAPSPTGVLHVGGARTALFNYLFAKSQGGTLVLRIEDTDTKRSTADSEAALIEGLRWCGISWDEGPDVGGRCEPYRQSERIEAGIYQEQLEKLIGAGHVYRCFLTSEDLAAMREEAEKNERAFVIDSPWSFASEESVQDMLDQGKPYTWRFRVPRDETVEIDDLVLGDIAWSTNDLGGDFVIVRNTGVPMYNFSAVVDDALMGITHVLRAQEHLSNTPKQALLYHALGFELPCFAHMPLILAPDRTKLSKRHGAVSVGAYKEMGYLPASMVNYLAQLGWNDGTKQEIYELDELMHAFKMERMSKVAAIFDQDKFKWVNSSHIRKMSKDEAIVAIGNELVRDGVIKTTSGDFVTKAVMVLKDRISLLSEAGETLKKMLAYPLKDMLATKEGDIIMADNSILETAKLISAAHASGELAAVGNGPEAFKSFVRSIAQARGVTNKKVLMPLRICLTGQKEGPAISMLFDLMNSIDSNVICEYVPLNERVEDLSTQLGL